MHERRALPLAAYARASPGALRAPARGEGDRCRLRHRGDACLVARKTYASACSYHRSRVWSLLACSPRHPGRSLAIHISCPPTQFVMTRAELTRVQLATAGIELHTPTRIHSPKQQGVVRAETICCKRLFQVFQMFQTYVASILYRYCKVDRDVAHVAMMFSSVSPKCFICFRRILQVFYLDVTKVDLNAAYTSKLQVYVSSVLYVCCNCVFLVFHTYVASVLII
jgi:hypothetical protein